MQKWILICLKLPFSLFYSFKKRTVEFSCIGKRKPAPDCYTEVLHHLGVEASSCIFVDDRFFLLTLSPNSKFYASGSYSRITPFLSKIVYKWILLMLDFHILVTVSQCQPDCKMIVAWLLNGPKINIVVPYILQIFGNWAGKKEQ